MEAGASSMTNNMEASQKKKKNRTPYDPPVPLWAYFKGNENSISESYLHSHVHCTVIHNSQDMETT